MVVNPLAHSKTASAIRTARRNSSVTFPVELSELCARRNTACSGQATAGGIVCLMKRHFA
jgi:hypothetical protein